MKKLSKTIAVLSMSLLAVGTFGQTPQPISRQAKAIAHAPTTSFATGVKNSPHKVGVFAGKNYLLDNVLADEQLSQGSFYFWSPDLFVNSAFDYTDTIADYSANSVTVAFDTLWDSYSAGYVSVTDPISVDTITAEIFYRNTSGKNDTLFFSINSVYAKGYKSGYPDPATVYGIDTLVITPSTLPYNSVDSVQIVKVPKRVNIPSSALHGWNFSVQLTVHAPKTQDSIGLNYYSQYSTACSAFGLYAPEPTYIGPRDSAEHNVNTFETGIYAYNAKSVHGTGTSLSWPVLDTLSPDYFKHWFGFEMNGGGYYYAPLAIALLNYCTSATDTTQGYFQDAAIYPSVSATKSLGVNSITSDNGLSVGQNWPNPYNKATTINYGLTKSADVTFTVCDITGRVISSTSYGVVAPGQYQINLNANSFSPGIYFYSFNVGGSVVTKKMVITN